MKSNFFSLAILMSLLAPTGCDAPDDSIHAYRGIEVGVEAPNDDDDDAAAVGEFDLMSSEQSLGVVLCCGHGLYTWDCSGDSNKNGVPDVTDCNRTLTCDLGACGWSILQSDESIDDIAVAPESDEPDAALESAEFDDFTPGSNPTMAGYTCSATCAGKKSTKTFALLSTASGFCIAQMALGCSTCTCTGNDDGGV